MRLNPGPLSKPQETREAGENGIAGSTWPEGRTRFLVSAGELLTRVSRAAPARLI